MRILNLTQHNATPEQLSAGVFEPALENRKTITELLTFDSLADVETCEERVHALLDIVRSEFGAPEDLYPLADDCAVMIGGAPFFMGTLTEHLEFYNFKALFAFSKRESIETVEPDGTIRKSSAFRHVGFVRCSVAFTEPATHTSVYVCR